MASRRLKTLMPFNLSLKTLSNKSEPWNRKFVSLATEEDIYYCFRLLLNRNPERKEWQGHKATAGSDLSEIVTKFLSSYEFKERGLSPTSLADTGHEVVETPDMKLIISSVDDVCGSLREYGQYEPGVTALVRRLLYEGATFVDIGANIGYFSLLGSQIVGPNGRVYAVEPYSYNIKLLHANLLLNEVANVEILPFALTDKRGFLDYDDSAGNSGNTVGLDTDPASILKATLVYGVPLDEELPQDIAVDLIKMDIEGAEHLALRGMKRVMAKNRPVLITELAEGFLRSVSGVDLQTYLEALIAEPDYGLAVIWDSGAVDVYGPNPTAILEVYQAQESMCMDVVSYPVEKEHLLTSSSP